MTVDREQILAAFQRSWAHIPLQQYDDVQKPAENALSALLAELEQAEKENQQLAERLTLSQSIVTDSRVSELRDLEARLAKVPALVEAMNRIAQYDDDPDVIASATLTRIAADAVYEWERE